MSSPDVDTVAKTWVTLASELCETPYAMLNRVDETGWKAYSSHAIEMDEQPRGRAFCEQALSTRSLHEIPDISVDTAAYDFPILRKHPDLRFYAGIPVLDSRGEAIGTLCVMDREPRHLSDVQRARLCALAELAGRLLSLEQRLEMHEKNLSRLGKFVNAGEAAMHVAHEVRNPLAVIQLRVEELQRRLEAMPPDLIKLREVIEKLHAASGKANEIVEGMRKLSADGENAVVTETNLSRVIQEAADFCAHRLRDANARLEISTPLENFEAECSGVQIFQLIVNLLNNATDAVTGLPADRRWIRIESVSSSDTVSIKVTDGGRGVPENVRHRIFEPLFTTKPPGQGSGLGLSISRQIVLRHRGQLYIDEACPQTCFVVKLPKKHHP